MLFLIVLFTLSATTPTDILDSCYTDYDQSIEYLTQMNPDIYFCDTVILLNLNENDIEKLGKELNWHNYLMISSQEFVEELELYQKYGIEDTLFIYPSLGTRDILPPQMESQISFSYLINGTEYEYDERISINPVNNPPIQFIKSDLEFVWHTGDDQITNNTQFELGPIGWLIIFVLLICLILGIVLMRKQIQ